MKASLRWLSLFSFLLFIGCGSDPDKKTDGNGMTVDAGEVPEKKPPEKTSENQTGNAKPENKDAGTTSMQQTAAADGCKSLSCKEPATCEEKDGKARCACPKGYEDVKGDGSECKDIDECDKGEDDCDKRAKCENKPGGFECKCPSPAYVGDGKKCSCAEGYKEEDGYCEAPDGKNCEDNADCQSNHCVSGICCADACSTPGAECTTAEGATCADGKTCKYATAKDGSACEDEDACTMGSTCKEGKCQKGEMPRDCDDKNPCTDDSCDSKIGCKNSNNTAACDDKNPCTLMDVCKNGSCQATGLKDCSAANDACNKGACDPADGNCKKQPMGDGMACDDADSCTKADKCTGGACKGEGNACGPNASACASGMPNTCTCNTGYHASNGLCVPDNDECAASNPCGANADCFDPSNNAGDATCTCRTDYEGDAKAGCTAKNPCMGNPCGEGRGTCTNGTAGKYTCACAAGFKAVAGKCVCDMQGTFAVRTELKLAWSNIDGIVDGSGSTYSWSIARHNYDAEGNLSAEMIQCGDTNLDLCGTGVRIVGIPSEAYAQYVPIAAYDKGSAASAELSFKLESPLPGSNYKTPNFGSLMGISLTDPLGAWPANRKDVQGGNDFDGSATNGARWIDTDGDTFFGLTTYAVGPSGAPAEGELAPIEGYSGRSPTCNLPYNYPPALDGLTTRRIKRFSSANRVISAFDGKIDSCDALSGNVTGPDNGKVHYDIRIGNCTRTDLNGNNEGACSSGLLDYLDSTQTPNQVDSDSFKMKRVKDDITCKEVRALMF